MIVCESIRLVFFAVPRTGSTAMEALLISQYGGIEKGKKHSTYKSLTPEQHSELASYTKVAGLRNPFDSLFSMYWKFKSEHNNRRKGKFASRLRQENWDFNRFISEIETRGALQFFMQFEWGTLHNMNAFIRFESMQSDWAELCRDQGWRHETIPLINPTNKPAESNYKEHCDQATIDIIREHCRDYLNKYNYDF